MKGYMLVLKPGQSKPHIRELTAEPPLEDIKAHLNGGWLETVTGFTSVMFEGQKLACVAFCDEEGKLKELEFNSLATIMWDKALRVQNHPRLITYNGRVLDRLVGPVVVLAGDDEFIRSLSQDGE